MNDAFLVRGFQGRSDLECESQRILWGNRSSGDSIGKRVTL